ncbi:MAG TPA: glycosyltransferase [Anaerolineales bacterium]|nr:glycosyltransferase [Anaerolineales bacterium]
MKNNPKIVLFSPTLNDGGMENKTALLANQLFEQGWDVSVWVLNNESPAYSLNSGITLVDLKLKIKVAALFKFIVKALTLKPDRLVSVSTPFNALWILVKILTGYPRKLAVSERNQLSAVVSHSTKFSDRLRPLIARTLYPHADKVLCVSESVRADLESVSRLAEEKLVTLYNMIDLAEIDLLASKPAPPALRELPVDQPIILAIGRLNRQKNLGSLMKAFTVVRRKTPIKLVILGEGPLRADLEKQAAETGFGADILLPGFDPNPFPWFQRAEVLVLPSLYEGLPGVLLEGLAMRKKIVATDCPGGSAEVLMDGKFGKLVPVDDSDSLAAAILSSLGEPANLPALRDRARDFSTQALLSKTISILSKF